VIDLRRVAWKDQDGKYVQLWPSDEYMYNGIGTSWAQHPGQPTSYSIAATPNLRLQFYPPPIDAGTLDYQTCDAGAPLDPTANGNTGTLLGVPDDVVWGVRYRAMSKLLRKDGMARDEDRASICDQLYALAVDITRSLPVLITAAINDAQINITSLTSLDGNTPGWQGRNTGKPTSVAVAGIDTLALSSVPDDAYAVTVQVVRNAVVPVNPSDFVQVSRDDIEAVIVWAEMSAAFKSQGASLEMARMASKLMATRAMEYNERRTLQSAQLTKLLDTSHMDDEQSPMFRSNKRVGDGSQTGANMGMAGPFGGNPTSAYSRGGASQRQSRARMMMIKRGRRR
jgi:hypothetical protein